MTRITSNDLNSVMGGFFNQITDKAETSSKYPMTDIAVDRKTNILFIDVALAGFKKENIELDMDGESLVITAKMDSELTEGIEFVQKHIARRDCIRKIKLNPRYIGGDIQASFEDGMLCIILKPKKLEGSSKIKIS